MTPLSRLAGRRTVDNVYVFVADSLRFDALPEGIAKRGVVGRTIAASTYTASSIPSMMTGAYPRDHLVWNFEDVLEERPPLFDLENSGMSTNAWDGDGKPWTVPPMRGLKVTRELVLDDAESPFVVVEHDKGAHAPYDYFNVDWDDSPSFFTALAGDVDRLPELYERGVETVCNRFLARVEALSDRGLLDETLVVFTSDHGELLGEPSRGGIFGHGSPICPELVEVPTVFIGGGLPDDERIDGLLSGVDLAPTLLGALGRDVPTDVDGRDLWNDSPERSRVVPSDFWANTGRVRYGGSSAWDENGGVVVHHGSVAGRGLYAVHRKLVEGAQAPANRSAKPGWLWRLLDSFVCREAVYGTPQVDRVRGRTVESFETADRTHHVEGPTKEQLRALGYIE